MASSKNLLLLSALGYGVFLNAASPVVDKSGEVSSVNSGESYSYELKASDSDFDSLTWSDNSLPSWLQLSSVSINDSIFDTTNNVKSVAIDDTGVIYVGEDSGYRIKKIDTDGTVSEFFVGARAAADIKIDSTGQIYVSEWGGVGWTSRLDSDGTTLQQLGQGNDAYGIAIDSKDNAYFIKKTGEVYYVSKNGTSLTKLGSIDAGADVTNNYNIAIDDNDNLYVSDKANKKLWKVALSLDGSDVPQATTLGSPVIDGSADITDIYGLIFDKQQKKLFFLSGSDIKSINTTDYTVSDVLSVTGATSTYQLASKDGEFYVADRTNKAIKKVAKKTMLTGTPSASNGGDNDVSLSVTDGTNPVGYDFTITVQAPPVVTNSDTRVIQMTHGGDKVKPFENFNITDPNSPTTISATITYPASKGELSGADGGSAGSYTISSGTVAEVLAKLQALEFTSDYENSMVNFIVTVADTTFNTINASAKVFVKSPNEELFVVEDGLNKVPTWKLTGQGAFGITGANYNYTDIKFDSDNNAYAIERESNSVSLYKLADGTWTKVGSDITINATDVDFTFDINDNPIISYSYTSGQVNNYIVKLNNAGDGWDKITGDYISQNKLNTSTALVRVGEKIYYAGVGSGNELSIFEVDITNNTAQELNDEIRNNINVSSTNTESSRISMKVNSSGMLYVAFRDDANKIKLLKVDSSDGSYEFVGGDVAPALSTNRSIEVLLDSSDNIYVGYRATDSVKIVDFNGTSWSTPVDVVGTAKNVMFNITNDDKVAVVYTESTTNKEVIYQVYENGISQSPKVYDKHDDFKVYWPDEKDNLGLAYDFDGKVYVSFPNVNKVTTVATTSNNYSINVREETQEIFTLKTNKDSGITWSKTGNGADEDKFEVDANTGELIFASRDGHAIADTDDADNDNTFEVELQYTDGSTTNTFSLSVTLKADAQLITSHKVKKGRSKDSTTVSYTPANGNSLRVAVGTSAFELPIEGGSTDLIPGIQDYTSGADLTGVDKDSKKFVGLYEVDADGLIVGFASIELGAGDIATVNDYDWDGISDEDEGKDSNRDTDSDGTPDYQDTDSDGDGVLDIIEGSEDTDGDGKANYVDNVQAPVIISDVNGTYYKNEFFEYFPVASDADSFPLDWNITKGPDWLHVEQKLLTKIVAGGGKTDLRNITADNKPNDMQFKKIVATATDVEGNIYVADQYTGTISKIDTDGAITVIAGGNGRPSSASDNGDGGPASDAKFYYISSMTTDIFGNIYVADKYEYNIRKIDTSGNISTIAGITDSSGDTLAKGSTGLAVENKIKDIRDMVADGYGNLYLADYSAKKVYKIDTDGVMSVVADGTNDGLKGPHGIDVDVDGNIYIADYSDHAVKKVAASDGTVTTIAGTDGSYSRTVGEDVDATGADGKLFYPTDVKIDKDGTLYISDKSHYRVRQVKNGKISTFIGTGNRHDYGVTPNDNTRIEHLTIEDVYSITFSPKGEFIFADSKVGQVYKLTQDVAIRGNTGKIEGSFEVTLEVSDGVAVDTQDFKIDVANRAPKFIVKPKDIEALSGDWVHITRLNGFYVPTNMTDMTNEFLIRDQSYGDHHVQTIPNEDLGPYYKQDVAYKYEEYLSTGASTPYRDYFGDNYWTVFKPNIGTFYTPSGYTIEAWDPDGDDFNLSIDGEVPDWLYSEEYTSYTVVPGTVGLMFTGSLRKKMAFDRYDNMYIIGSSEQVIPRKLYRTYYYKMDADGNAERHSFDSKDDISALDFIIDDDGNKYVFGRKNIYMIPDGSSKAIPLIDGRNHMYAGGYYLQFDQKRKVLYYPRYTSIIAINVDPNSSDFGKSEEVIKNGAGVDRQAWKPTFIPKDGVVGQDFSTANITSFFLDSENNQLYFYSIGMLRKLDIDTKTVTTVYGEGQKIKGRYDMNDLLGIKDSTIIPEDGLPLPDHGNVDYANIDQSKVFSIPYLTNIEFDPENRVFYGFYAGKVYKIDLEKKRGYLYRGFKDQAHKFMKERLPDATGSARKNASWYHILNGNGSFGTWEGIRLNKKGELHLQNSRSNAVFKVGHNTQLIFDGQAPAQTKVFPVGVKVSDGKETVKHSFDINVTSPVDGFGPAHESTGVGLMEKITMQFSTDIEYTKKPIKIRRYDNDELVEEIPSSKVSFNKKTGEFTINHKGTSKNSCLTSLKLKFS